MIIETERLASALIRLREKRPVVHAITNGVTIGDVANALQAVGARPIMASSSEEVLEITSRADALVLNLGTPDPQRVEAMFQAGRHAKTLNVPVVLDPVGAGASRFRMVALRSYLAEIRFAAIRGNGAEIGVLAGMGGRLRGIDSAGAPADPESAAKNLSRKTGAVVVMSGSRDVIAGKNEIILVENGHPMMAQVTGTGCMLSAILGAFIAAEPDPLLAVSAGAVFFGLAGEQAALGSRGPGSFRSALLDALYTLKPEDIRTGAKIRG
jgi:hydroxyethylthiazole kinase